MKIKVTLFVFGIVGFRFLFYFISYLAKILVEDGDAAPVGSTVALLATTQ